MMMMMMMIFRAIGGMKIWQGKPKYSEKTYPSATLSTTKSHMTDTVSIPGPQRWEASD
jgi:hypothetical protein